MPVAVVSLISWLEDTCGVTEVPAKLVFTIN
jgi:hypothetical protein